MGGVGEVRRTLHFLTVALDYETLGGRYVTRPPTSKGASNFQGGERP